MSGISIQIWGLLLAMPFIMATGQLLFKMTSVKLQSQSSAGFAALFFEPVFILALAIYGGATFLWIYILKSVPLTQAYSFMALTFIIVPLLALFFLGEAITLKYVLGACLIIGGLMIIHA